MKLPALWIAAEGTFQVTDEPLTSCSYVAYRNGFFRNLCLVDAAGDCWVVTDAALERTPNLLDRLLNRGLKVELRLSGPERRPLSEIAEKLCACVDRHPGDVCSQFVEPDQLKRLFRSAQSSEELLHHARMLGSDSSHGEPA